MAALAAAGVPTLSELCARAMLDNPELDVETKLAVLDRLKSLSKARSDALEREVEAWQESKLAPTRRRTQRSAHREAKAPEDLNRDGYATGGPENYNDDDDDDDDDDKNSGDAAIAEGGDAAAAAAAAGGGGKAALRAKKPRPRARAPVTRKDPRDEDADEEEDELARADAEAEREEALKYKLASEAAKRRRKALQEVFTWKQRFTKLAHQAQVLDRERQAALRMARGDLEEETATLAKDEVDLDRKRDSDRRDLTNQLDKAKWAVERLVATVAEMGAGDAYLRAVDQQMEHCESLLTSIKSSQRVVFEELASKEDVLSQELAHLATRFDLEEEQDRASRRLAAKENTRRQSTRESGSARGARSPLAAARSSPRGPQLDSSQLKARIEAIDEEVADRGGSTGHWDSRDHADFLRCVSRLKVAEPTLIQFARAEEAEAAETPRPIDKLLEKAGAEIPSRDQAAIEDHVRWYGIYLSLLSEKKRVVREWKSAKSQVASTHARRAGGQEQANPNANDSEEAQGGSKSPAQVAAERRQHEKERKREREERRRAVAEWKAARDAERRAEIAAKEAEERVERERRAEEVQRRRDEKERIALFKLQREAERDRQKSFAAAAARDAREHELRKASVSLKERQARDLALATQRRQVTRHKQETEKQDRAAQIQSIKIRPAVRPGFEQKLKSRSGLTEATTAFDRKRLTPEELGEMQERRARTRAHDSTVPSAAAASLGGRSYAIGVKNLVGGRAGASWRS